MMTQHMRYRGFGKLAEKAGCFLEPTGRCRARIKKAECHNGSPGSVAGLSLMNFHNCDRQNSCRSNAVCLKRPAIALCANGTRITDGWHPVRNHPFDEDHEGLLALWDARLRTSYRSLITIIHSFSSRQDSRRPIRTLPIWRNGWMVETITTHSFHPTERLHG